MNALQSILATKPSEASVASVVENTEIKPVKTLTFNDFYAMFQPELKPAVEVDYTLNGVTTKQKKYRLQWLAENKLFTAWFSVPATKAMLDFEAGTGTQPELLVEFYAPTTKSPDGFCKVVLKEATRLSAQKDAKAFFAALAKKA